MNSGIEAAVKKFHELRSGSAEEYSFAEAEFNALGYRLIQSGKIVEAVEVFKMNVVLYPESSNVYDSLGEAYIYLGDKERAIASYEKVLELNPNNGNAKMAVNRFGDYAAIYNAETQLFFRYTPGEQTGLKGSYLGQTPPGKKAEVFAPGLVSTRGGHEFCCTFSPDGREFYFNRGMTIMVCRWEEDGWTAPEPASFNGPYRNHEPHITSDNERLFFGSFRPQPGIEGTPYGIWMMERTEGDWGEPSYVGFGMYVTTTSDSDIYLTALSYTDEDEEGIVKTRLENGRFAEFERQEGGVMRPAPDRRPGRHPCIAPDGSFIIFDAYKKPEGGEGALFVCFRRDDGSWSEAIELGDNVNTGSNICASLSPDGKYLFYFANKDITWVRTEVIEQLRPK